MYPGISLGSEKCETAVMRTSLFLASLLASYRASLSLAIFVEPPFTPGVTDNILNYSRLPSRVDELKLIAGINPTTLANFLGSVKNTENSQPNPIAESFPNSPTGTINGTYTILPIDYELARSIIPRRYGILKHSIREVLPGFPEGKYPVRTIFLQALIRLKSSPDIQKVVFVYWDRP